MQTQSQITIPPRRSGAQDLGWLRSELTFEKNQTHRDDVRIAALVNAIRALLEQPAGPVATSMTPAELQRGVSSKTAH